MQHLFRWIKYLLDLQRHRKSFVAKALPNGIGGGTTELIVLRQKSIFPEYTYYVVSSQRFIDRCSMSYKGIVGQQRIKSMYVNSFLVPLPPFEEQIRIAGLINTVFEQIDIIDELQAKYNNDVEVLKSKVIDAATRGELTEQLPEDGNAEDLYNQIQEEKEKLIKEGKIKKQKQLPDIEKDEIPFEIPSNWKWVRLADVSNIINGDRGKNYPAKSTLSHEGIPFISALNLNGKDIDDDERLLCLNDEQYNKLRSGKLHKGDIVICIRGSLGKHGKYPYDIGAIASSLVICRSYCYGSVMGDYIMTWLDSSLFPREIHKYDGGAAQPNLAADNLKKFLIPIPTLNEQQRIANKLDMLIEYMK